MDIARQLSIGSSPVYRIGIELGLWKRNPHGRKAAATTGRCSYLQLRANALGRKDAALACGIHPRNAADIDKGVIKLSTGRVPFVPAGPDVALYNRLMQVIEYVDGRQAVPVQVIPQQRIDRRISSRYLSVEERELIFDLDRQGKGVREIARRLQRSAGTISKELKRNRDEFGVYLPTHAHRKGQVRGSGVSVLSESRDSVIGGVRGRLGVDVGSLGCFFGGLRVAVIEGVGGYEVSGLLQARQRHVALLLDPIIMLLG